MYNVEKTTIMLLKATTKKDRACLRGIYTKQVEGRLHVCATNGYILLAATYRDDIKDLITEHFEKFMYPARHEDHTIYYSKKEYVDESIPYPKIGKIIPSKPFDYCPTDPNKSYVDDNTFPCMQFSASLVKITSDWLTIHGRKSKTDHGQKYDTFSPDLWTGKTKGPFAETHENAIALIMPLIRVPRSYNHTTADNFAKENQ